LNPCRIFWILSANRFPRSGAGHSDGSGFGKFRRRADLHGAHNDVAASQDSSCYDADHSRQRHVTRPNAAVSHPPFLRSRKCLPTKYDISGYVSDRRCPLLADRARSSDHRRACDERSSYSRSDQQEGFKKGFCAGIYDLAGNKLLSGHSLSTGVQGIDSVSISPVTLPAGQYLFCWGPYGTPLIQPDSGGHSFAASGSGGSATLNALINKNSTAYGTAANTLSGTSAARQLCRQHWAP
jgi:hypothetical protein